jgi:hypothetical protein
MATIAMRIFRLFLIQKASLATSVLASNGSYLPCALHFHTTQANLDILTAYANDSYLNNPVGASSGILDHAGSDGPKPWLRQSDKDKKVVIECCFETKSLRDRLTKGLPRHGHQSLDADVGRQSEQANRPRHRVPRGGGR